jgi:hypothetical protein
VLGGNVMWCGGGMVCHGVVASESSCI